MKKLLSVFVLLLVCLFSLVACKTNKNKLLKTNYEKVQLAFNGVESSLSSSNNKMSTTVDNNIKTKRMAKTISNDDITTIFNAMEVIGETNNPSFDYDEPPMIQFQYLKALYEEIGEGFSFGTKYSYSISHIYINVKKKDSIKAIFSNILAIKRFVLLFYKTNKIFGSYWL